MTEKVKVNQKDVINRTGSLMLKGWKLLATCCPICHTALLSKDSQMRCPGCDMPVVMEGHIASKEEKVNEVEPSPNTLINHSTPVEEEEVVVDVPTSYEELRREYEEKNKKSNQVSSKLGEKMLQGWTMLAESCPDFDQCGGTPLMKEPSTGSILCVSCNREYFYGPNGDLRPKGEIIPENAKSAEVKEQKPSLQDFRLDEFDDELEEPPRIVSFQQKKEDDSSWKISQKLLLGWSLLDASCNTSKCNGRTPLLKDLKGKRYCVDCGYIDEKKEEAKEKREKKEQVSVSGSRKKTVQELIDEEDNEEEVEQKVQNLFTSSLLHSSAPSTKSSSNHFQSARTEIMEVQDDVVQVLTKKLRTAGSELDKSNSIEISIQYATLITKLAESLKAVQSI